MSYRELVKSRLVVQPETISIGDVNDDGTKDVVDVTGGAAHTMDGFKPSQYDADLTMNGTAQSVALATSVSLGSGRVRVVNLGATTEAIRFAFGTSAANAEANLTHVTNLATTGLYIPSNVDAPGAGIVILGVPALATHYAVENAVAADVQVVSVTQGV